MSIPVKKVLEVSPTLRSVYSNGMDRDFFFFFFFFEKPWTEMLVRKLKICLEK